MYSFRAYDLDQDNRISRREFVTFIEDSWKAAFRILGEAAEKSKNISLGDVTNWSNNKISLLNEQSTKLFNSLDVKRTGVPIHLYHSSSSMSRSRTGYSRVR